MKKPVAVCTRCNRFSYEAHFINQQCGNRPDGKKRCQGVYKSALSITDWEECNRCNGTGRVENNRCSAAKNQDSSTSGNLFK